MSMFTLPDGISLDDWDEYETGCIEQRDRCEHEARIIAFGAIRRAVEIARRHDHKHTEYCAEHGPSWTSPGRCEASAIRYAIRAAIVRNIEHSDEKTSMGEAS